MRMRRSFFTAIMLIVLLAFTASIALAEVLPPEDPTVPDDSTEQTVRMPGENPVAWFLSQYFTEDANFVLEMGPMSYEDIMVLHESYGFGNLARIFFLYSEFNSEDFNLPEDTELPEGFGSFEDFMDLREEFGWGVLYKELGLHPNEGSLGWAFKNAEEADKPGNGPPDWKMAVEPEEPDDSGGAEVTVTGGKPDKPDKPGKPDKPDKPDQAGPKDKKPKDK